MQLDSKNKEKEAQFQRLEEYVNENGLSLAFNIIFAELISKQILPENFFTYTSMRLRQIGKEIEVLIETKTSDGKYYVGRSKDDVPDIDGLVYVKADDKELEGKFIKCKVIDTKDYDLIAKKI